MEEGLPSEHSGELLGDPLEDLLDGGRVANKGGGHGKASGRDVTDSSLHIVGDPFDKVGRVLVLHIQHLLIHLFHRHAATEDGCHSEVAAMPGVASSHHVLGVKHLLGELGHGERPVLLAATGGQRGKAGHEEVEAGEGDHVDRQLPQVGIQLAGEPEEGGQVTGVLRQVRADLRQVVTPDMVSDTRWFKSPYVGVASFRVLRRRGYDYEGFRRSRHLSV